MSRFWSEGVDALRPYQPGEQPKVEGLVKLNTNENPYGPSPRALAAIRDAANDALRLYPDPDACALRAAIGADCGVPADHVFVGNGSDEVLGHAFAGLMKRASPILVPDVTYSFYRVWCELYRIERVPVPLDDAFRLRVDDYARPCGGVVIANPNAPTGIALPIGEIERLLRLQPAVPVLVDEAYVDFGAHSAVPLVARHPNLLVVRTLSKSHALAGLRVGWAIGQPSLLEALERVKGSFNSYPLDRLALAGAAAAVADRAHFERSRDRVVATRAWLAGSLAGMGFEVLPSSANFLFVRHPLHDAARLQAVLRESRVLVRRFTDERIAQFLRVSVGTDDECGALVRVLREQLG